MPRKRTLEAVSERRRQRIAAKNQTPEQRQRRLATLRSSQRRHRLRKIKQLQMQATSNSVVMDESMIQMGKDPCSCNMRIATLTSHVFRLELLIDKVMEQLKINEQKKLLACAEREKQLSPGSAIVSIEVPDILKQSEKNPASSLHEAAQLKNTLAVARFLARGADPNAVDDVGNTPLHYAASSGDALAAELLLACGAASEVKNDNGFTPLLMAAWFGCIEVANALIQGGAEIDQPNLTGHTPLMCAIILQHTKMVSFLESKGASLDVKDFNGDKPLVIAAMSCFTYSLKILINSPRISVEDVMKALEVAGSPEAFRILKNAVSVSKICSTNYSLLPRLAELGWEKPIDLLLHDCRKCEDDDHMRNLQKALCLSISGPIMLKIWRSKPDKLRKFAMNRAAVKSWVNALDVLLQHWMIHVGSENHLDEIKEAMRGARNPEVMLRLVGDQAWLMQSSVAHEALWMSAEYGWVVVLKELIAKGVPLDVARRDGTTALHCAAGRGHTFCVELLLMKGASPNVVNEGGRTPLHVAVEAGYTMIMEILLNAGAEPNIEDPLD